MSHHHDHPSGRELAKPVASGSEGILFLTESLSGSESESAGESASVMPVVPAPVISGCLGLGTSTHCDRLASASELALAGELRPGNSGLPVTVLVPGPGTDLNGSWARPGWVSNFVLGKLELESCTHWQHNSLLK